MAQLSTYPRNTVPMPVSPNQRLEAIAGNIYTNRIGGQRFHLSLRYMNIKARLARLLWRDMLLLLSNPAVATIPTDGTNRNVHLAGGGYIWVDGRRAAWYQTHNPRTIASVAGSVVTFTGTAGSIAPLGIIGEFVTVGSELCTVIATSGNTMTVWPRPNNPAAARGSVVFDRNRGLHGGWFELPAGEGPGFPLEPVDNGEGGVVMPLSITLQGVVGNA